MRIMARELPENPETIRQMLVGLKSSFPGYLALLDRIIPLRDGCSEWIVLGENESNLLQQGYYREYDGLVGFIRAPHELFEVLESWRWDYPSGSFANLAQAFANSPTVAPVRMPVSQIADSVPCMSNHDSVRSVPRRYTALKRAGALRLLAEQDGQFPNDRKCWFRKGNVTLHIADSGLPTNITIGNPLDVDSTRQSIEDAKQLANDLAALVEVARRPEIKAFEPFGQTHEIVRRAYNA